MLQVLNWPLSTPNDPVGPATRTGSRPTYRLSIREHRSFSRALVTFEKKRDHLLRPHLQLRGRHWDTEPGRPTLRHRHEHVDKLLGGECRVFDVQLDARHLPRQQSSDECRCLSLTAVVLDGASQFRKAAG